MYVRVQNELAAAYNEIRNEVALERFGERYIDLNKSKQKEIRKEYPQKISEAEPKKYREGLICQSLETKIIKEPQLFLLHTLPDIVFSVCFSSLVVTTGDERNNSFC